jgi:hypothetical protein
MRRRANNWARGTALGEEHKMQRTRSWLVGAVGILAVMGIAASCAPPPPAAVNWSFRGTNMTVNDVQDEVCVLICVNTEDEPYLLQVAFKVTIGQANSAQAWKVKGSTLPSTGKNQSRTLTGGQQATVNFTNVRPLDVLSALNSNNKLDIVGTYTWAAEEDFFDSLSGGADAVANLLKSALNSTLASASLPSDANALINLVLDLLFRNLGSAFQLIASNIPCLGTCDDVLGGRVYVGIGATGSLATILDSVISGVSFPTLNLIGDNSVPPNIQGGALYTLGGPKTFAGQVFTGAGGRHTYTFEAGPT